MLRELLASDVNRLAEVFLAGLRAPPPLPRLHPPRAAPGPARGDRLLPGLSHLRRGRRPARSRDQDAALRRRGHRRRRRGAPPRPRSGDLFDFFRDLLLLARVPRPRQASRRERAGDALPAAHRPGDGQGGRGHRLLQLQPPGLAQRGGRRSRPLRDLARGLPPPPAPRPQRALAARDARRPRPTTPSAARTCGPRLAPALRDPGSAGARRCAAGAAHNERHRRGRSCPDRNTEYLFYQTLVGAWPLPAERAVGLHGEGGARGQGAHLLDAARTPTTRRRCATSSSACWPIADFIADLAAFVAPLVEPGRINSLAQTLLKLTAPGVPDIYQGSELWDLTPGRSGQPPAGRLRAAAAACSPSWRRG